jgi:outer membrane autotransporter protein
VAFATHSFWRFFLMIVSRRYRSGLFAGVFASLMAVTSAAQAWGGCDALQGNLQRGDITRRIAVLNTGDQVFLSVIAAKVELRFVHLVLESGSTTYVVPSAKNGATFDLNLNEHLLVWNGPITPNIVWSCTPAAHSAAAHYSVTQGHALLTHQLGQTRQVDRLGDFGGTAGSINSPVTGFTAAERLALDAGSASAVAPHLGMGRNLSRYEEMAASLRPGAYEDEGPRWLGGPAGFGAASPTSGNLGGLRFSGSGDSGAPFNFSASLRDVAQTAAYQEQQRLAQNPAAAALGFAGTRGKAPSAQALPLDIWVEGRFTSLNDGRDGADLHGRTGLFGVGIDYVFNPVLLAGVSLSFDSSVQKTTSIERETKGNGWLAGPYATLRVAPDLYWQTRLAAGRSNNEATHGTNPPETFGSTRWLGTTKLTGRYQMGGAWQLRPSAGVAYMEEISDEFASSGSSPTVVKTRVGTATAGPEISYQYRLASGWLVEPRVGTEAIWTFTRDVSIGGTSETFAGDAIGPPGLRGRVEIGLRAVNTGGTVIDFSGAYDGIGAGDYNATTGRAVLRVPLN